MKYILSISLLVLSLCGSLYGQEMSASVSVSKNPVVVNELFEITVTTSNISGQVRMPQIDGLVFRRGVSNGQNHSIVNGKRQSEYTYGYSVQAKRTGEIKIPPIQVNTARGVLTTSPLVVKILSNQESARNESRSNNNVDLFVAVEPSKRKAYLGQGITLNYYIYSRYSGLELENYTFPDLDGFWSESVPNENASWQRTNVNGIAYNRALLKSDIVFPQQSGNFRIENFAITGLVRTSFFNRNRVEAKSRPVTIEVLPLPPGQPQNFLGTYISLRMEVELSKTAFNANEAFNLEVTFRGNGNLKLLEAPKIEFPKEFEVFEPKVKDSIKIESKGESGSRKYTYVVIPRLPGDYTIPQIATSFFNPAKNEYQKLTHSGMNFTVERGAKNVDDSYIFDSRTDVEILNQDIRYIKDKVGPLRPLASIFYGSILFWSLFVFPPIAFFVAIYLRRRHKKLHSDQVGYKRMTARKTAQKWLKEASTSTGNSDKFFTALLKGLESYVSNKFNLSRSDLSKDQIQDAFTRNGLDQEGRSILELISWCEMARYSPHSTTVATEKLNEAEAIISKIEQTK
jgi:hypothetical protein